MTVFFFGDVAVDEYWRLPSWPTLGDKVLGERLEPRVGGMVANAARVHASLGGNAEFVTVVRPDDDGTLMLDTLRADGVGTEHVILDHTAENGRTQVCSVGGDHAVLIHRPRPDPILVPGTTWKALCAPGWLVTNLPRLRRLRSSEASDALTALRILRSAGRRVLLDLDVDGIDPDGGADVAAKADVVITNDNGFARSFADESAARDWLASAGTSMLVRTRGAHGATAYTRDGTVDVPGYAVDVVDVTGAGDTFAGALVLGLAHDWDLGRVLDLANAAAARSVSRHGPAAGRTSLTELQEFMAHTPRGQETTR